MSDHLLTLEGAGVQYNPPAIEGAVVITGNSEVGRLIVHPTTGFAVAEVVMMGAKLVTNAEASTRLWKLIIAGITYDAMTFTTTSHTFNFAWSTVPDNETHEVEGQSYVQRALPRGIFIKSGQTVELAYSGGKITDAITPSIIWRGYRF